MRSSFIITNIDNNSWENFNGIDSEVSNVNVFCKGGYGTYNNLKIIVDGYVVPRNNIYNDYKACSQYELIGSLYERYGSKVGLYIKGYFCIIEFSENKITISTDHIGLHPIFYYSKGGDFIISDSINPIRKAIGKFQYDPISLAAKSIMHRNFLGYTDYKYLKRLKPGTRLVINEKGLLVENYWNYEELLKYSVVHKSYEYFAEVIKKNFTNFIIQNKSENHAITLTGGKDSRTGLAALLAMGEKPLGFTYGNKGSKDAVYAKKLANELGLNHFVYLPPCTADWWNAITDQIISYGNPDISIHRAHRLYAFNQMAKNIEGSSAYYAGYMAGEFLMGVYYDNLVFTKFLTDFWESSSFGPIESHLIKYFHYQKVHPDDVLHRLCELKTFNPKLNKKEKQFHGIFEIGIPHHAQDIFLASQQFNFVYPFFIDIDFLQELFSSTYSFFYTDNQSKNLYKRYKLYEFNLNIQHILCPAMDNVPFGKRGSYTTSDFLKGRLYWTMVKGLRYFSDRKKYPASFSYDFNFRNFLMNELLNLANNETHNLHYYYDVNDAISSLNAIEGNTGEAELHRFSNIVSLFKQMT